MERDIVVKQMREYARENNVPIITDDGLDFLTDYIKNHSIYNILEIGTAIGYSAICMCLIDDRITVTSIERDEVRYREAVSNVSRASLGDRINLIFGDALETSVDGKYDLIFIDAAKAQSIKFFEKYEKCLKKDGTIITDNMSFHGLVDDTSKIESRNVRQLVRKIKNYKEFLENNSFYDTSFFDIGDGMAVSIKK